MTIYGLQKMTLLDFPGHVACTVFLGGCDLRCPFCHNYELALGQIDPLENEETFFSFLKKRQGLLDGVVVSGGEPCLHRDLLPFFKEIRQLDFLIKLDTNGLHPDVLKALLDEHLIDYAAMDIKNSLPKYPKTTNLSALDTSPLKESISLIMHSGIDYEFRTTVVEQFHTDEDFEAMGKLIKGAKHYYLQPFVMRDTVPDHTLCSPDAHSLERYAAIMQQYVKHVGIRGMD